MPPIVRFVGGPLLLLSVITGGYLLLKFSPLGLTLFLLVPLVLGAVAAWIGNPGDRSNGPRLGALSVLAGIALIICLRWDGAACVLMASPLVVPLGALGGYLADHITRHHMETRGAALLFMLPPIFLTWDLRTPPPVYEVRTAVDIKASPQTVWRNVVSFPDLPSKRPWYFHTGIAYPIRARITGRQAGAIRTCEFSTGAFIEPIEVWDEGKLLRFRVTANPPPLEERNPFGPVHAKHLDGFLLSRRGQFRLLPLPGGGTRLEGTTWYTHGLAPAFYWRWWSDAIIHCIHLRVLDHIRNLSENGDRT